MKLLLLAVLATQDSSAFLDPAAARLVAAARARREREERLVTSYSATVTQRVGVGIRALRRDRMLYRSEMVARIDWRRDSTSRVEFIGARHAVPVAVPGLSVPDDLDNWATFLAFDPAQDYLRLLGQDREGFIYPLADGAEAHYRYRSGDTITVTLPDDRTIRLLELRVTARRAEFRLMTGSLWLDDATLGVVRAVFRPARPFDFELDADEDEDDVPAMFKPIRAEVRYVTIEYGLFSSRWWLPRFVAMDAEATAGGVLRTPLRFERTYTNVRAQGGSEPPEGVRRRGAFRIVGGDPDFDEDNPDSVRALIRECVEESRRQQAERRREDERGIRVEVRVGPRECWQRRRGRPDMEVVVPLDTNSLLTSPELGAPILDMGDVVSEGELRQVAREIGALPDRPWQGRFGAELGGGSALKYARFNRVEGLSLGSRLVLDLGKAEADVTGRLGVADLVPNVEAGFRRRGFGAEWRLAGYHRLAAADPSTRPFGLINTASGLLFGRDDGEYFRATGFELSLRPGATRSSWVDLRLYVERQRPESVRTNASLPRLFDSGQRFRPNILADTADQFGAALSLRGALLTSTRGAVSGEVSLDGGTGTYEFGRGAVTGRAIVLIGHKLSGAVEVAAGTSTGAVPVQSRFYLGGAATLRGYTGGAMSGPAFWRTRGELALGLPLVRLAVFSDAGWAGARSSFSTGRSLISAGIGASFLDGLFRLDLSRAMRAPKGWRVDLYADGVL